MIHSKLEHKHPDKNQSASKELPKKAKVLIRNNRASSISQFKKDEGFNANKGNNLGVYLNDNREKSLVQQKETNTRSTKQSNTIQRISLEQADKSKEDEKLVWFKSGSSYEEVRIIGRVQDVDNQVSIVKMDGSKVNVLLTTLYLINPKKSAQPQVGIDGVNTPGLSKPIPGENMIHRGIVETEMVGDKPHVRVYSALMGAVEFDKEDAVTGIASSTFKDIHQTQHGNITISTGQNSVLWANMGRPLRAVKWSEKYFAQLIEEKPELKPDYIIYTKAISDIDNSAAILVHLESELKTKKNDYSQKERSFRKKSQSLTKNQTKSLGLFASKIEQVEEKIREQKQKIRRNKADIQTVRTKFGKSANPIIRSFLIPFASFEKISKAALPERLHGVVSKVEDLAPTVDLGTVALVEIEKLLQRLSLESIKYQKDNKEVINLSSQKKRTKNQQKRLSLRQSRVARIELEMNQIKLKIVAELQKYEAGIGVDKKEQTKTKDHNLAYQKAKEIHSKAYQEVKKLMNRAMPDLAMGNYTAAGILAEMKKRNLHQGSINVDVHYEPNQFGLHGEDMNILRRDAVPGSLKSYALFPEMMTKKQKEQSGELHSVDVLKTNLGIPLKNLAVNPWLNGSGFAKKKEFSSNAKALSGYYATWLKMKQPGFKDDALLEKDDAKIPFKVRENQLRTFLKENNVDSSRTDDFMEKVVAHWASQSMIAHIMSTDFDQMNMSQSLKSEVPQQDFGKMRANLPIERSKD